MSEEKTSVLEQYHKLKSQKDIYAAQYKEDEKAEEQRHRAALEKLDREMDPNTKKLYESWQRAEKKQKGFGTWFLSSLLIVGSGLLLKKTILPLLSVEDFVYYIGTGVVAFFVSAVVVACLNAGPKRIKKAAEKDLKLGAYLDTKRTLASMHLQKTRELEDSWTEKWSDYYRELLSVRHEVISQKYPNALFVFCKKEYGCSYYVYRDGHKIGYGKDTQILQFKLNPGINDITIEIETQDKRITKHYQVDTEGGAAFFVADALEWGDKKIKSVTPEEFEEESKTILLS